MQEAQGTFDSSACSAAMKISHECQISFTLKSPVAIQTQPLYRERLHSETPGDSEKDIFQHLGDV